MAGCEGHCVGIGYSNFFVRGKCPTPCDDAQYGKVDPKIGQGIAKEDANARCKERSKNDECVCHGGEYKELKRQCVPSFAVVDGVVVEQCEYQIWFQYEGNCSKPS